MYAHRQIYDHAQATIAVPPELQHRCIEVIFMALDGQRQHAPNTDTDHLHTDILPALTPQTGRYLLDLRADIPPAQSPEEELVIEPRSLHKDRWVDFE